MLPEVDALVDCGNLAGGPPSTLVQLDRDGGRVLREGAIPGVRVLEFLRNA
jgi:tRNA A37 threonylcarbamoyladenosine synthetase subunit TsaC/SUA5/YrdC